MRRETWRATTKLAASLGLLLAGCTQESLRIALESQRRADEVQQAVFARQHDALCGLLYRDALHRLAEQELVLEPRHRAALSELWNDRDLVEFWAIQHERARALRLAGVDAKLFADQSIVDLLWKQVDARIDRTREVAAARAAQAAAKQVLPPAAAPEAEPPASASDPSAAEAEEENR
ncbi:MAG: hypothetical protein IPM13_08795 [Phycisphaerales bacterium]|nr:hypothetical protein [Phycisphaerales bacterium]